MDDFWTGFLCGTLLLMVVLGLWIAPHLEPCSKLENNYENVTFIEIYDNCYVDLSGDIDGSELFMLDDLTWEEQAHVVIEAGATVIK